MPQFFHPSANTLARVSIFGAGFAFVAALAVGMTLYRSGYYTRQDEVRDQPVPFSHKHHVYGLGIDCRYCHTSVENSSFAGIPPTETCMSCHSQIWTNADLLQPVRESLRTNIPIHWVRVNDLPDFVYFNHSIHIAKGIGCETCHGRVDQMPLMRQAHTLQMSWCLDCHRNPEQYVRPREEVFTMGYQPPESQAVLGARLVAEYHIQKLTNCYTCHR
jgi:Cytochrome c7 and related cytochrome c